MAKLYGFTFKNNHSWEHMGLTMQSVDRSLLPAVKRQQVDITAISGKYDLQAAPVYDNRAISVKLTSPAQSPVELQARKRAIASWLTGRASLIFDDEPALTWDAKVFEATAFEQTFKTLTVNIIFECAPIAVGARVIQPVTDGRNPIDYHGNIKTPTLIILRNEGSMVVESVNISAVVRTSGRGTV